jgi:AraC-like DNA-binding protein
MDQKIQIDANMNIMRDAMPIRFSHRKSLDKPENHTLHLNNHVEIYIYVSGNHNYIVENNLYELKRGDIIVINPREVHKALPLSEAVYERFYFLIDCNAFDGMNFDPLARILKRPPHIGNLISFDDKTRQRIVDILYEISNCFCDGRNDQLQAFGYFIQILDEIDRYLENDYPSSGDITQTPELLKKILIYVAMHTKEIQTISEISNALDITPQYLSSYFSKQVGTPLKTYIQAKKIALAKNFLDKGADVTWTCYECGFNDCSYFIKIFKKYVTKTPMEYKKEMTHKKIIT